MPWHIIRRDSSFSHHRTLTLEVGNRAVSPAKNINIYIQIKYHSESFQRLVPPPSPDDGEHILPALQVCLKRNLLRISHKKRKMRMTL